MSPILDEGNIKKKFDRYENESFDYINWILEPSSHFLLFLGKFRSRLDFAHNLITDEAHGVELVGVA